MRSIASNLGVVLVAPFWSQSDNMNSDSNYAYLRIVLPELARKSENTLFLLLFPDPDFGNDKWHYTQDGLQSERIRFIKWPYDTAMATSVLGFPVMRWKEVEDKYGPCLYWIHQVEMGHNIAYGYKKSYSKMSIPSIVAQHRYVIHKSLPYPYETQFGRQWNQIGGSIAAHRVVFNSEHTKHMAREAFSDFLNDTVLQSVMKKSSVLHYGLIRGDEPVAPEATDHKPVILYNHRFEAYKKPELTASVLGALRSSGYDFSVWITQAVDQRIGNEFPVDRVIHTPLRPDYLRAISVPAINTINTVHETFCIAMLDSIMLGHLCVCPNAITFPELLPQGYPYLFNSVNEQKNMLQHILSTWPAEYNKWRPILAEHARTKFDLDKYTDDYLALLRDAELAMRVGEKTDKTKATLEKVIGNMKKGKVYPVEEIRKTLHQTGRLGNQSMPTRRVVRELMLLPNVEILWQNGVCFRRG